MTTATIETPQDQISKPDGKVLFMARRRDLRLVKVPRYPVRGADGRQVGEKPGEALQFVEGVFRCPTSGKVTLEGGVIADAAEVLAWLEEHRALGNLEEGFWRVDPVAPPPSTEEVQALVDAATELDEERLEAILEAERSGWGREDLMVTAQRAVTRIQEIKEQARAQLEAEGQKPPE